MHTSVVEMPAAVAANGDVLDPEFEEDILGLLIEEPSGDGSSALAQMTVNSADLGHSTEKDGKNKRATGGGVVDKHREDREAKRQKNSGDLSKQAPASEPAADAPYDAKGGDKKNSAEGTWDSEKGTVELNTMRGNFWRIMGFTESKLQYLNPEEALLLAEKSQLRIYRDTKNNGNSGAGKNSSGSSSAVAVNENDANGRTSENRVPLQHFYDEVLQFVPQAVLLVYNKLKFLDYICMRHKQHNGNTSHPLRSFSNDADVYAQMKKYPNRGILESLCAFDVYPNMTSWSKKAFLDSNGNSTGDISKRASLNQQKSGSDNNNNDDGGIEIEEENENKVDNKKEKRLQRMRAPSGYVIVQTGDWTMNSRLAIHLLRAAKGVPIIFAAVLPSGNLILEELCDARTALVWDNVHAIDISFSSNVTMENLVKRPLGKNLKINTEGIVEENVDIEVEVEGEDDEEDAEEEEEDAEEEEEEETDDEEGI